jgi:hypothetical protein
VCPHRCALRRFYPKRFRGSKTLPPRHFSVHVIIAFSHKIFIVVSNILCNAVTPKAAKDFFFTGDLFCYIHPWWIRLVGLRFASRCWQWDPLAEPHRPFFQLPELHIPHGSNATPITDICWKHHGVKFPASGIAVVRVPELGKYTWFSKRWKAHGYWSATTWQTYRPVPHVLEHPWAMDSNHWECV